MSTDQNKEVVIRWLEARDKGNWEIINELFAPDYVCHLGSDPDPVRGRDKVKQMNVMLRNAFEIYATHEPDVPAWQLPPTGAQWRVGIIKTTRELC